LAGFPERRRRSEGCPGRGDDEREGDTPLVIVDTLKYHSQKNQLTLSQQLSSFVNEWKKSWDSLDTETYLSYYSRDFMNSEGMNYQTFEE
jgi:hypothetical protein